MLYIKVKRVYADGQEVLTQVSRFLTNEAMNRVHGFSTEVAAAILNTGSALDEGFRYVMGHTLPAQEMAEATEPFYMNVEKEDGSVTSLTVSPGKVLTP